MKKLNLLIIIVFILNSITWYYGLDSDIATIRFSPVKCERAIKDDIVTILPIIEEVGHEFEGLIHRFEGLRLVVYNDLGYKVKKGRKQPFIKPKNGTLHIGYGHKLTNPELRTGKIHLKDGQVVDITKKITKDESFRILKKDAKEAEKLINKYVNISLNQNEYDAFASYIFNVGYRGLFQIKNGKPQFDKPSKFLKYVNKDNIKKAVKYIDIVKSGGKVLRGLVKRRHAERKLALKPIED